MDVEDQPVILRKNTTHQSGTHHRTPASPVYVWLTDDNMLYCEQFAGCTFVLLDDENELVVSGEIDYFCKNFSTI